MARPTRTVRLGVDSELEPRCTPAAKLILDGSGFLNYNNVLNIGDATSGPSRVNTYWANDSSSSRLLIGYDDIGPLKSNFVRQQIDSAVNGNESTFNSAHLQMDHPSTRFDRDSDTNLPDDAIYDALMDRQVVYRVAQLVYNGAVVSEHGDWVNAFGEDPTNTAESTLRPQPVGMDLSSSSMTTNAGNPISAGSSFTVTTSVRNAGPFTSPPKQIHYRLTQTRTFTDPIGDVLGIRDIPTIPAGQSATVSQTLTLPNDAEEGTWYIHAILGAIVHDVWDDDNNPLNNFSTGIGKDGVQITVAEPVALVGNYNNFLNSQGGTPFSGTYQPGGTLGLSFPVYNRGGADAPRLGVYYIFSADGTADAGDAVAELVSAPDTAPVASLQSRFTSATLRVPALTPGTYRVGWVISAFADPNDASGIFPGSIQIAAATGGGTGGEPPPAADFRGASFAVTPAAADPGQEVTVSYTLENLGVAGVPAGQQLVVRFYVSTDSVITAADIPILDIGISGFLSGPRVSPALTVPITLPASLDRGRTYYVGMVVDPDNAVFESDESNNASRGAGLDSAPVLISGTPAVPVVVPPVVVAPPVVPVVPPPVVVPPPPARPTGTPVLVGSRQFAVGGDAGTGAVTFFNPDGTTRFAATPFADFAGGVRTASADFTGDGVADLVVGTGPGAPTRVRILDGQTQRELFAIDPFEASFTGGIYVAAGDVTGDGVADLVITPDQGGGPRVRVFSGQGWVQVADFFGIDDPGFRGGARAAVGDVNGDGVGDLLVGAGAGGGPRLAGFDGRTLTQGRGRLFGDFFVFEQTLRNGVFLTAGDLNGDGLADLVVGGGPGGAPRVFALSGAGLVAGGRLDQLANFFAGNPDDRGGVRLAVKNLDGDNRADLVVGSGVGAGSRLTTYAGNAIPASGTPPTGLSFDALPGFAGGIYVG